MVDRDLREWIEQADRLGGLKLISGADCHVEIGAVTELGHRGRQSHALLFDSIKGYREGYRALSNTVNTVNRMAMTPRWNLRINGVDFVKKIRRHMEVDDIDVTNTNDVLWSLGTRSNPEVDTEITHRSWSGHRDPIIPKAQKGHSSRAILDACRPYQWLNDFPAVAESSPAVRRAAEEKWRAILSSSC